MLEDARQQLRLLHQVSRRKELPDDAQPRLTAERGGSVAVLQQTDHGRARHLIGAARFLFLVVNGSMHGGMMWMREPPGPSHTYARREKTNAEAPFM